MSVKRVFFDLGLTLVESDVPARYVEYFHALGCEIPLERAQRAYHMANKFFMRECPGALGKGGRDTLRRFLEQVCRDLGFPGLAEELYRLSLADRRPARWTAFPFAEAVLAELRARKVSVGLISNWDASCRDVLGKNGLTSYLDPIVISSEVGVEKPDPRIFQIALERSGCRPEECLYVGDNYYDDGVGASQVGMGFCILNPPGRLGIEELKLSWTVPDIRAVPRVMETINQAAGPEKLAGIDSTFDNSKK